MTTPLTNTNIPAIKNQTQRLGYITAGALLIGIGLGLLAAFGGFFDLSVPQKIGAAIAGFAAGWFFLYFLALAFTKYKPWWALIPATVLGSLAACFYFSSLRLLDFVIYVGVAIGIVLLAPGLFFRLLGLIIPGCLVASASAAVFSAWASPGHGNPLTQTGVMLVVFSLGWVLITLCSRVITDKFVWWPLIPGGILAMTGWGLYIGGDPNSALSFIGNTGSIGLIIFGIYLILLRRGLHR